MRVPILFLALFYILNLSYVDAESSNRYNGIIVDPHAQIDHEISDQRFIQIAQNSGVTKFVLSSIYFRHPSTIISLARQYPDLIIPAVRTKTRTYIFNPYDRERFKKELEAQSKLFAVGGMQELLGYHAIKPKHSDKEPKQIVNSPTDKKILIALKIAQQRGWPLLLHYEFSAPTLPLKLRNRFLTELDELLRTNRNQPIVLTHLGQLNPHEIEHLIGVHQNIFFTLAETNRRNSSLGFVCTFERYGILKKEWQHLFEMYPDRFVLSLDGVFKGIWVRDYGSYIEEWRVALGNLPLEKADLIAHGNAQRLWSSL